MKIAFAIDSTCHQIKKVPFCAESAIFSHPVPTGLHWMLFPQLERTNHTVAPSESVVIQDCTALDAAHPITMFKVRYKACDPGHNDVTRPQLPELSWWSYPLFNPIIPRTNLLHLHPKHSLVPKTPQSFTQMRGHRVNAKLIANPCPCHEKSSQACRWEVGQPQYFLKTNSSSFWCKYFTIYLSIVTWSCSHNGTACLQGVVRAPLSGLSNGWECRHGISDSRYFSARERWPRSPHL